MFNQPLSFDTSKVTTMRYMFGVRSARALPPHSLESALPPVHATCVAATQRPRASRAVPLPASHARLSTRQQATAFNQALSFDMSKVTDQRNMFDVRSARTLPLHSLESGHPRARRWALPSPHALSPRIVHTLLSTRQGTSGGRLN